MTAPAAPAPRFTGSFTQQEPLPDDAIAAALEVMRHGRLHRYNLAPGEAGETALLEEDFAAFTGARYCLAVASGGYALACALRALGVAPGAPVLTNAFTLAPVPGAIVSVGAHPILVEITEDLVIDLHDLAQKARASGARVLMLSHMRGHIADMGALMACAQALGLQVIEDCAHTMGASFAGVASGRHGVLGCYSTQTYKHMNSGEGGLIVGDDPQIMARAVLLSGSYMLYPRHRAAPPPEAFADLRLETPNVSGRMDNLRAALLRPQLARLPARAARWNALHDRLAAGLRDVAGVALARSAARAAPVRSSFQFRLPGWSGDRIAALVARAAERGVELKWFGAPVPQGFTSTHASWRYLPPQALPRTDAVLATLLDLRLPLTFSEGDVDLIARILAEEIARG
ncbi:DegT/DnrJ/EryC1/StrS family aminotransferase [Phaeovulum vinaykumarii]|uniref:dTDP-4-amino-4,6-dideoxygalactose transaminase n=1 Tax=Phaeovulum vinaykumarii TaxID=407234 RepID=A0A1N7LLJ6_9RHOB|nr:DegT/DnrJ/EryC1/StrS family aminotransferase [Phaeovulum vinaykumarii]SIS74713.1 dTDP-4-amino-4,6-dideoxygalactose transaminase [Phaeovulum vinaykumarii]SOC05214.1 dTDP-4-amino-4,6-dideoxygalactose transaminase [Phaeovulum vinaykumarii]